MQAFQELSRGEKTATALENQLASMEAKIDALLARAEEDERELQRQLQQSNAKDEAGQRESKAQ